MPIYPFACDCGNKQKISASMKDAPKEILCDKCSAMMYRLYKLQRAGTKEYTTPLHSDSLAITPGQVAEHKQLFPNIEIDNECRPVFHNYTEHDNYLKATGFVKKSQRIRAKGKNIHPTPAE